METLKVQAQIRQNAMEMQDYFSELNKWEKDIKKRDRQRRERGRPAATASVRTARSGAAGQVRGGGTVRVPSGPAPRAPPSTATSDGATTGNNTTDEVLTPATLANASASQNAERSVATARGNAEAVDAELSERSRGNRYYSSGDFAMAAKSYTRCLGLKSRNYLAFSNRSMAYLKLREFPKAEADATCALEIHPDHVKSLLRRAAAENALGKHRAALGDLMRVQSLDPSNKQAVVEVRKTKELLRSAVARTATTRVAVTIE